MEKYQISNSGCHIVPFSFTPTRPIYNMTTVDRHNVLGLGLDLDTYIGDSLWGGGLGS